MPDKGGLPGGQAGAGGDAMITMADELERHDVLLAEGLPAESYFDTGGRCNFENGEGAVAPHPDFLNRGGTQRISGRPWPARRTRR